MTEQPIITVDKQLANDEKRCPFCGEIIKTQAVICKHCNSDLNKTAVPETARESSFIFICPECYTTAELPESMKDKTYECKGCCETFIAEETSERACPSCGKKIKIKATVCKYCKHSVKSPTSGAKSNSSINQNIFVPLTNAKFCDFKTRARRSEYWMFTLACYLIGMIPVIGWLFCLFIAPIPHLAVTVRRLHDTGRSGWNLLLVLIPIVGPIIFLIFLCQDSEPGSNQYGCNPKGEQKSYNNEAEEQRLKAVAASNLYASLKMQLKSHLKAVVITAAVIGVIFTVWMLWLNSVGYARKEAEKYYTKKDFQSATKWYLKVAEDGDTEAQHRLGLCYYETRNFSEATKWYRKAAEQGHALAQINLGLCYVKGKGVSEDLTEAGKWFQKAAEQGNANAQYILGNCYYSGIGVSKNYAEAVKWYKKAAEQGNANAQIRVGDCYDLGHGVERSTSEAIKWYHKADQSR